MFKFFLFILINTWYAFARHATNWDFLIFSQRWPITTCVDWQESKVNHTCNFPTPRNIWTVHGVWPTTISQFGPFFCNKTAKFDVKSIESILPALENYWTNVEADTGLYSFWEHEWSKHGTCAINEPELFPDELTYFKQGLQWIHDFGMQNVLAKQGIKPGLYEYNVKEIITAVRNDVKSNPIIECIFDKKTKEMLISEIRLCFNKSLDLIDCDVVKTYQYSNGISDEKLLTNCNLDKPLRYMAGLPTASWKRFEIMESDKEFKYYQNLQKTYKFLQLLIQVLL